MDSVSGVLENSGKFSGKLKQILFWKSIFLMKNDGDDGVNAKQHFSAGRHSLLRGGEKSSEKSQNGPGLQESSVCPRTGASADCPSGTDRNLPRHPAQSGLQSSKSGFFHLFLFSLLTRTGK